LNTERGGYFVWQVEDAQVSFPGLHYSDLIQRWMSMLFGPDEHPPHWRWLYPLYRQYMEHALEPQWLHQVRIYSVLIE
jgi:hypothetical protein